MRALVTGATGFIGRHLVLELRRRDWDIVCMTRRPVEPLDSAIRCTQGDLLDPASFGFRDVADVDVLFHFAAQLPAPDILAEQYLAANCTATARLLQVVAQMNIPSVVYASSLPVIGSPETLPITEDHPTKPQHPYHLSKLCGEMACEMARRVKGMRVTSLRITSPYGPGMSSDVVLARFVNRALRSEDIQWMGTGSRAQNFVHVSDVVNSALLAAETEHPGIYNIGGAETTSMQKLAQLVVRLVPDGRSRASSAGIPDPEDGLRWEVDISRAASGLRYRPQVSLEQGLADYIGWMRSKAPPPSWWRA